MSTSTRGRRRQTGTEGTGGNNPAGNQGTEGATGTGGGDTTGTSPSRGRSTNPSVGTARRSRSTGATPRSSTSRNTILFATSPLTATQGIIDFSTKEGILLHEKAVKGLSEKYDVTKSALQTFVKLLSDRVDTMGWSDVRNVTVNGEVIDVVKNYGTISYDDH